MQQYGTKVQGFGSILLAAIHFPSVLPTNHKETPLLGYTDNRSFGRTIKEM
jgi:hypothetical protein